MPIFHTSNKKNGRLLIIWQNTTRGEQQRVIRIIEEKLPSIKVYFQEGEPGSGSLKNWNFLMVDKGLDVDD